LLTTHTIHCSRERIIQIKQNVMGQDDTVAFHELWLEYMANVYQPVTFVHQHGTSADNGATQDFSERLHYQNEQLVHSTLNYLNEDEPYLPPSHDPHHTQEQQFRMSHKYFVFRKNSRTKVQWRLRIVLYDEFGSEIETKEVDRIGKFSLEDLEWLVMRDLGEGSSVLADLQKEHRVAREMYDFSM